MPTLDMVILMLLAAALVLLCIGAGRRIQFWRRGKSADVPLIKGLLTIPKRYLVDLHHVVERDRYISNTHVATAGGMVAALVLLICRYLFAPDSIVLSLLMLAASASMFVGALFVYKRRQNPPERLSRGPWMRLPKSLLAFALALLGVSVVGLLPGLLPDGVGGWIIAAILLVGLFWGLTELIAGPLLGGPMKHAFAGALHLAYHRRPERFGGGRSTGLKPLYVDAALAKGETLGVGKTEDFTWNQLLGFDACVQCGRCESKCPAFAAGQPLNPKKLIQDMVVGLAGGSDANYAGSPHPGVEVGKARAAEIITDGLISNDTLWSCTTCRACVEECPMMIEHVDAIVDMRRYITMEQGKTPEQGAVALENLIATDNPGGYPPAQRTNWSADLSLPLMCDKKSVDVLFWIGDGAFDMRSQKILRSLVTIMRAADIDFAVLGDEEKDCGDVARRLGDEATFEILAKQNIAQLQTYQFNTIVTTDPHALQCLKNEYVDFGGNFEVQHHSTYIAALVEAGCLQLDGSMLAAKLGTVTWHDPCYLGRYNGEYEAPRRLIKALGLDFKEMERSGYRSRCCGGGGAAPITDVPGKQRIADMRMAEVVEVDAKTVVVGCQQCTAMLEGVVEPRPAVLDIGEVIVQALAEVEAGSKQASMAREAVSL